MSIPGFAAECAVSRLGLEASYCHIDLSVKTVDGNGARTVVPARMSQGGPRSDYCCVLDCRGDGGCRCVQRCQ